MRIDPMRFGSNFNERSQEQHGSRLPFQTCAGVGIICALTLASAAWHASAGEPCEQVRAACKQCGL